MLSLKIAKLLGRKSFPIQIVFGYTFDFDASEAIVE